MTSGAPSRRTASTRCALPRLRFCATPRTAWHGRRAPRGTGAPRSQGPSRHQTAGRNRAVRPVWRAPPCLWLDQPSPFVTALDAAFAETSSRILGVSGGPAVVSPVKMVALVAHVCHRDGGVSCFGAVMGVSPRRTSTLPEPAEPWHRRLERHLSVLRKLNTRYTQVSPMDVLGTCCAWIRFVRRGLHAVLRTLVNVATHLTLVNAFVDQSWWPPRFPWSRPSAAQNPAHRPAQHLGSSGIGPAQLIAPI